MCVSFVQPCFQVDSQPYLQGRHQHGLRDLLREWVRCDGGGRQEHRVRVVGGWRGRGRSSKLGG